jgi:hypothetical protein
VISHRDHITHGAERENHGARPGRRSSCAGMLWVGLEVASASDATIGSGTWPTAAGHLSAQTFDVCRSRHVRPAR